MFVVFFLPSGWPVANEKRSALQRRSWSLSRKGKNKIPFKGHFLFVIILNVILVNLHFNQGSHVIHQSDKKGWYQNLLYQD